MSEQVYAGSVRWAEVNVVCGRVLHALVGQDMRHRLQLLHVNEGVVPAALLLDVDQVAHQHGTVLGLSSTEKLHSYLTLNAQPTAKVISGQYK